jgi:hypothetical protein
VSIYIELKAASQLLCSLCKEEGGVGTYYSAYQLLSHIFLSHRFPPPVFFQKLEKKIRLGSIV